MASAAGGGGLTMAKEICEYCEKVFEAGPKTFICPECRKKMLSENAKKRNLNKLGNKAFSEQCALRKAKRRTT